jgi:hypothetical protein
MLEINTFDINRLGAAGSVTEILQYCASRAAVLMVAILLAVKRARIRSPPRYRGRVNGRQQAHPFGQYHYRLSHSGSTCEAHATGCCRDSAHGVATLQHYTHPLEQETQP